MSYHDIFRVLENDHSQFLEPICEYKTNCPITCYKSELLKEVEDFSTIENTGNYSERKYCSFNDRDVWTYKECDCQKCEQGVSICQNYTPRKENCICYYQCCSKYNPDFVKNSYSHDLNYEKPSIIKLPECSPQIIRPRQNKNKLELRSAEIVKNFLLRIRNKNIFKNLKSTIRTLSLKDPAKLLKIVNYIHALIFDKRTCVLIFRLAGSSFPPRIVYKLFSTQKILLIEPLESVKERQKEIKSSSWSRWFPFYVYKCDICKSTVRIRPKISKKTKKKWRENNQISWIEKKYG